MYDRLNLLEARNERLMRVLGQMDAVVDSDENITYTASEVRELIEYIKDEK